ncbi:MAG: Tfp pilus assembly protein FimT/FimU [Nitrospinota bacterium]
MPTLETGKSNNATDRGLPPKASAAGASGVLAAKAGFTLVEIAIVVFIISLFTAFTLPRLPDIGTYKLKKNGRLVAHTITYLYSQAAAHRMLLRFNFDLKTGKYYASMMNMNGNFEATDFPLFKKGRLSDGVKVASFTSLYNGTFGGGNAYMHLMPEGFAEQSVIVLSDRSGRKLSLIVDPLSGRVRILKGEIDLKYAGEPA